MTREALNLNITGIVQGVGFRPFVYREAKRANVTGWVLNDVEGVKVHAEGEADDLDRFTVTLSDKAPAAAQVREISIDEVPLEGFDSFEIRFSDDAQPDETTLVSPDLATCDACVSELFDPQNRRYRYPFINCTNCGPRFTIIDALPYDRPATSMASFEMCPECAREYDDPADRRFHAQPDACFSCGPALGWAASGEAESAPYTDGVPTGPLVEEELIWARSREESDALLAHAVSVLRAGGIVAVKGLGGYHLVCDAANERAIARLRERKRRPGKPLAVMASSVEAARELCVVGEAEERQLTLPARPIVLLRKREGAGIAEGLADGLPELGIMLPATPVQHLLIHDFGGALVMTSGNVHDEPIVTTEPAALSQLSGVADAFLVNDREIEGRYDDSVVRVVNAGPAGDVVQMVRRARGFAPLPVSLPAAVAGPSVLSVGPEQKNTLAVTRGNQAFVSQHIGDVESAAVSDAWNETRERFVDLFRLDPKLVACDRHPEYLTTKWAHAQALPTFVCQHHHAHIAAVMAENGLEGPVCGFAFDGTGYGMDRAIWGGEVMLANLQAFERFANFAYFPLPGGAAAVKDPVRTAFGVLWAADLLEHPQARRFVADKVEGAEVYEQMIERGINCPQTSSAGRLFDAASALLGLCDRPRYEGEAAILLEAAAHRALAARDKAQGGQPYRFDLLKNTATEQSTAADTSVLLIDPAPVFASMLDDLESGVSADLAALRFHEAFSQIILQLAELVRAAYGIDAVALAGGVFMNRLLLEAALADLQEAGFTVALNQDLPPNDGAISYGQAVLALAAQSKE